MEREGSRGIYLHIILDKIIGGNMMARADVEKKIQEKLQHGLSRAQAEKELVMDLDLYKDK